MNVSDEELLKYHDGAMESNRAAQIDAASRHDRKLTDRILAMEASRLPYQEAFSQHRLPMLPESLIIEVDNLVALSERNDTGANLSQEETGQNQIQKASRQTWNIVGIAASLALCFLLGFSMANRHNSAENQTMQLAQDTQTDWVRRVADYQTLYVENTVLNVAQTREEATSLLNRVESGGALKAQLPDLSSQGYTFVRAQELGYKGDQLVQLVYRKPGVAPLALCFMPSSDKQTSELRIGNHEGLVTADWIQNTQRFVIVGEETPEVMKNLYKLSSELWI